MLTGKCSLVKGVTKQPLLLLSSMRSRERQATPRFLRTAGLVRKAIKCLKPKTSSGLDFVSPKILKASVEVITTPLTYIINNSFSSGEFMEMLYSDTNLQEKRRKSDVKMYRPVSNPLSVSKIIELIVNKQVLNYLETNKLLPHSQHGFRSG